MFPVIALMFVLSLAAALSGVAHGNFPGGPLAAVVACGVAMLTVFAQRLAHPEAFFDWIQGGVTGILQDDSRALRWQDWEIMLSRRGEIDRKTRTLRIEKRAFFDLIPCGTVERSLDEFYGVSVLTAADSPGRRLELRATNTRHELILDVGHVGLSNEAKVMVGRLRARLHELVDVRGRTNQRRDAAAGGDLAQRMLEANAANSAPPPARWLHPCELEHRGRVARRDHLLQLQRELDGARFVRSSRSRGWIHGRHAGRALSVSTWISDAEEPEQDLTWYTLAVDTQALVRVSRPQERLQVAPEERDPYEIKTVMRSHHSDRLYPLLQQLFDELGCQDLTIERGTIYAEKPAHALDLCPNELNTFFACLTRIAEEVERFEASLVSNVVAHEQTRCPFCRDDLRAEEQLVACVDCGTIHHDECFEDLGECTIRGCSSQRAEPVTRELGGGTRRLREG